jgi:hypothetical protein
LKLVPRGDAVVSLASNFLTSLWSASPEAAASASASGPSPQLSWIAWLAVVVTAWAFLVALERVAQKSAKERHDHGI